MLFFRSEPSIIQEPIRQWLLHIRAASVNLGDKGYSSINSFHLYDSNIKYYLKEKGVESSQSIYISPINDTLVLQNSI